MKKDHYHGRTARRKPYLSAVNKQMLLTFANEYVNKSPEFWGKVMFSDKSKFCIFGIKVFELMCRKQGTVFEKQNLVPAYKCTWWR